MIALQAAMPLKDMATSTAAYGFIRLVCSHVFMTCCDIKKFLNVIRTLGGTIGVSVGQVVFSSVCFFFRVRRL